MGSSCKGSDDTVFGELRGTGIVAHIEVGVCRFSVIASNYEMLRFTTPLFHSS